MSKPTIEQGPGVYRFTWEVEQVHIAVTRAREFRERATAEIKVQTTAPGVATHLHQASLNLTSTRARQDLAKHLSTLYAAPDWVAMLEQLCYHVLERLRQGEPVEVLCSEDEAAPPSYLLWPLIPECQPSILFGIGGTSKSLLALIAAITIQAYWEKNPLGFRCNSGPANILYLDWETDRHDIQWRLRALSRGMGLPSIHLCYRRCALPLADDLEAVQEMMLDHDVKGVIVDSVAAACGGDLNATEPAIRLFGAIRQLNTTAFMLAHAAKNATEDNGKRTPFGSAFYWNFARSVWEVQKQQEVGEDEIEIGLFHRKANSSRLQAPLGFRVTYGDDFIKVVRKDVAKISSLADRLPARTRIASYLKQHGRETSTGLAEELGIDTATIRKTLQRMRDRNEVVQMGANWGMAVRQYEAQDDEPF